MFDLLRRNCENIQNFDHYLDNDIGHRVRWWNFRVGFEAFEEVLDTLEEFDKGFFTCADIFGSLTDIDIKTASQSDLGRLTKKRTPIPAEIIFVGENICENN